MGILGVWWESREYDGDPRSIMGISEFPSYFWDFRCTSGISVVLPGFSSYSQDFHRTSRIPVVLPGFPLYSRDSWNFHCTPRDSESKESTISSLPGSTIGIPGLQLESWEYNGNPGSTVEIQVIPGVQWESRESWEYEIRRSPLKPPLLAIESCWINL
jgi:hypothetical protein